MWNYFSRYNEIEEQLFLETDRILEAYGNHPSFVMLSSGNEPHTLRHECREKKRSCHSTETSCRIRQYCADQNGESSDPAFLHLLSTMEEKLLKEVDRLAKQPFSSAEAAVIRNYLDVCLDMPWGEETSERASVSAARKLLDRRKSLPILSTSSSSSSGFMLPLWLMALTMRPGIAPI